VLPNVFEDVGDAVQRRVTAVVRLGSFPLLYQAVTNARHRSLDMSTVERDNLLMDLWSVYLIRDAF
jgi:hypothetical protein